jgi:hypothetical protein
MCMKNAKSILFALGILSVLLAGCFNPITAIPPKQGDPATDPFTVSVLIGKDAEAGRSITGPDAAWIKGEGIRNIIQLVVVDEEGAIVAFDEARRASDDENTAVLRIESIPFGRKYHFLLLMGHWERDYAAAGYVYNEDVPPTLLAAGLKENYLVTGSGTVTVTMWPIVVDTVFTTGNTDVLPETALTAQAAVSAGKPGMVNLLPVNWGVSWTVRRGEANGNGLTDLITAQKVIDENAGDALLLLNKETVVRGAGFVGDSVNDANLNGNVITLPINTYTSGISRIGTSGSANFRLEYVPFNLRTGSLWSNFNSVFDLDGSKAPVWIIRNGVNDLAQNSATDFTGFGTNGNSTANANGAVSFTVTAGTPASGELVISNGAFKGTRRYDHSPDKVYNIGV